MASLPGSGTASGDSHQFYEPQARSDHCCCTVGQNVYIYGHSMYMTVPPPSGVVDVFNLPSGRWQQLPTTGPPPPGVHGSVCAVIGKCLYLFGGTHVVDGVQHFYNTIHKLDVVLMLWKQLEPAEQGTAPMEKYGAGMVSYYESSILVFSGYGPLPADPHTRPADYIPHPRSPNWIWGWTNELHLFDLQSRTWSVPGTTGTPPPACCGCSFTRVDKHRGVVFGGLLQGQLLNHIHILNLQSWHWLKVESSGASGQPWPDARFYHTAVSVCDPDGGSPHPALLVCWGQKDWRVFSDIWLLSVNTCQWKQVTLPSALRGRAHHTTAVVHHDEHHKQLVHFGGIHEIPPDGKMRSAVPVTETTIVELESSGHPGDWIATRVNQLGRTVAGGDGVAMASHHLPLGGVQQPPIQTPLYRPEIPPTQLPLDIFAQPSVMLSELESLPFLDPLKTLRLLPPTQPQPVLHSLPLTSMQPGPAGTQSTQTGYATGTQPLYYPSLTPSSMGFSSMISLPPTSSIPAVSQYVPPHRPMYRQLVRPLQANPPMPMHAQPVVRWGVGPGPAAPQQQPQQHMMMRPVTQQPTRGEQLPPPATLTSQPSTEQPTPTTSLLQAGTPTLDYLSLIPPPSPAFETILPQIAPSPASRQPTVLQPTLLGPPVSRHYQLPPSASPTAQPSSGLPTTHPSSTDSKIASLEVKEPKREPMSPQLKEEPQSPGETLDMGCEETDTMVPVEKLRQVQMENKQLRDKYEELRAQMDHIVRTRRETTEDVKATGDPAPSSVVKEKLKKEIASQESIIMHRKEATVDVKTSEYKELREEDATVAEVIRIQEEAIGDVRTTGCFRGVDVIGETSLIVTNEAQTFHWEGYGLKLHIPPASLPARVGQTSIEIKASLTGQFNLPENTTLVSAVYSLQSPVEFSQPIAVEIQHCATPSDDPSLTFARASQEDPPYKFTALEGGLFPTDSCYACIHLSQFSKYGIIIWNFLRSLLRNWRYRAHIYYTREAVNTWMADFVITHDLEACITSVKKKYGEAKAGPTLGVTFESDEITLQVPREGFTLPDHWTITPLTHPGIAKEEVDSYKCGQVLPFRQLRIKWRGKGTPDDFECMVGLNGAKEPHNFFLIALECESTAGDASPPFQRRSLKRRQELTGGEEGKVASEATDEDQAGVGTSKKAKLSKEEGIQPPTLEELLDNVRTTKWFHLGIKLGVREDTLEAIEKDRTNDASGALMDMLRKWLRECENPTWVALVCAMRQIGEGNSARQLEDKFC